MSIKKDPIGIALLPESFLLPKDRIPIEDGYIHFYLFIVSYRHLVIFGETFTVSKDLVYEYVEVTTRTGIHTRQVEPDDRLVDDFWYVLLVDGSANGYWTKLGLICPYGGLHIVSTLGGLCDLGVDIFF